MCGTGSYQGIASAMPSGYQELDGFSRCDSLRAQRLKPFMFCAGAACLKACPDTNLLRRMPKGMP